MAIIKEKYSIVQRGKIHSINHSKCKGTAKKPVNEATLIENFGLEGDAHGGPGIRQVSLLAVESIQKQKECAKVQKKNISLKPGDFAENITTEGLDLVGLRIGNQFKVGKETILELTKIGKECHRYCSIYYKTGDCIMPREGIFAKVIKGGRIAIGDEVEVMKNGK